MYGHDSDDLGETGGHKSPESIAVRLADESYAALDTQRVGRMGELVVELELLKRGWIVGNFNSTTMNSAGWDLFATRGTRSVKIRVKAKRPGVDCFRWSAKADGSVLVGLAETDDDFVAAVSFDASGGYHLWEFRVDDRRYGLPDTQWPDDTLSAAKNIKLKTLLDRGVGQLDYTYDMGDNWHHVIAIESVGQGQPDTKYPRYIDGARRAPPEDVGGTPGFENFLDAIADPKHPDHAELTAWYDESCGEMFNPETIDELIVKRRVASIAIRRATGKAAYAKRQAS